MANAELNERDALLLVVGSSEESRTELCDCFLNAGFRQPLMASNAHETATVLSDETVSAVILDLSSSAEEELESFSHLFESAVVPFVAVANPELQAKLNVLAAGAHDFFERPYNASELIRKVTGLLDMNQLYRQSCLENQILRQMVQEQMKQLQAARVAMLQSAAGGDLGVESLLKGLRMSQSCYILAKALKLEDGLCEQIRLASPMQDIGSIAIPDRILQKNGRLSFEEREIIKTHVLAGDEILASHDGDIAKIARQIARHHHERWDGNGYPEGLEGESIPLVARIAAICDVFDALTTERPHKAAWSTEDAIEEISARSGSHFDPSIVPVFIETIPEILASRG